MELTISDLKRSFLPGLEAACDDEAVSEVMINGPGIRRTRWPDGGRRRAGADHRSGAGGRPDRPPAGQGPEHGADHRRASCRRIPRRHLRPAGGAEGCDHHSPFGGRAFTVEELTAHGSLPATAVDETAAVLGRDRNLLISGGTGSGKTTLLNTLVSLLRANGRIISIEGTLELRLRRANCLRFEARGLDDRGVTIRAPVRHALRHRPDHVFVGEVRGAEAADLLQALNTGHAGSLATVHANNAAAALSRLATCAMQAADALPWAVVCRGVVDGIEAVIHQMRTPEGVRRVDQMVRVRDYDATQNRWVVEAIWPPPSEGARNGPSTLKRGTRPAPRRKRRGRRTR